MAHWTDVASWKGPTPNQGGKMYEQRGLVIHIAEGYLDGTLAWQKNPSAEVSSHFIVGGPRDGASKDGVCYQVVDTDTIAWTQSSGNGHWLSIECSGFTPDKLSEKQIDKIAHVFAKCHLAYGVPVQIATSPNGKGLGHHSMGCDYGWGHCDCPGPNIINQKQAIIDRTNQILSGDDSGGGDDLTPDESKMLKAINARLQAIEHMQETLLTSWAADPTAVEPVEIVQVIKGIDGDVETLKTKVDEILAAMSGGTPIPSGTFTGSMTFTPGDAS